MNPAGPRALAAYRQYADAHRRAILYAPDGSATAAHEDALAILALAMRAELDDASQADSPGPLPIVALPDGTLALDSRLWRQPMD